jgi:dCTP deaminase
MPVLNARTIASWLRGELGEKQDPLVITPAPDFTELAESGAAAVDLRLGTWFVISRHTRVPYLKVERSPQDRVDEARLVRSHYVPFGKEFMLHPQSFVLAATLEWVRLPSQLAGYIIGRSSWGRRGLIIATASGIHPGFTGCLTLELTNVGDVPIEITPGMAICQLFLHETAPGRSLDRSVFIGRRRPVLGSIELDRIAKALADNEGAA